MFEDIISPIVNSAKKVVQSTVGSSSSPSEPPEHHHHSSHHSSASGVSLPAQIQYQNEIFHYNPQTGQYESQNGYSFDKATAYNHLRSGLASAAGPSTVTLTQKDEMSYNPQTHTLTNQITGQTIHNVENWGWNRQGQITAVTVGTSPNEPESDVAKTLVPQGNGTARVTAIQDKGEYVDLTSGKVVMKSAVSPKAAQIDAVEKLKLPESYVSHTQVFGQRQPQMEFAPPNVQKSMRTMQKVTNSLRNEQLEGMAAQINQGMGGAQYVVVQNGKLVPNPNIRDAGFKQRLEGVIANAYKQNHVQVGYSAQFTQPKPSPINLAASSILAPMSKPLSSIRSPQEIQQEDQLEKAIGLTPLQKSMGMSIAPQKYNNLVKQQVEQIAKQEGVKPDQVNIKVNPLTGAYTATVKGKEYNIGVIQGQPVDYISDTLFIQKSVKSNGASSIYYESTKKPEVATNPANAVMDYNKAGVFGLMALSAPFAKGGQSQAKHVAEAKSSSQSAASSNNNYSNPDNLSGWIAGAGEWYNQHVAQPVGNFFSGIAQGIDEEGETGKEGIENIFGAIGNAVGGKSGENIGKAAGGFVGSAGKGVFDLIGTPFSLVGSGVKGLGDITQEGSEALASASATIQGNKGQAWMYEHRVYNTNEKTLGEMWNVGAGAVTMGALALTDGASEAAAAGEETVEAEGGNLIDQGIRTGKKILAKKPVRSFLAGFGLDIGSDIATGKPIDIGHAFGMGMGFSMMGAPEEIEEYNRAQISNIPDFGKQFTGVSAKVGSEDVPVKWGSVGGIRFDEMSIPQMNENTNPFVFNDVKEEETGMLRSAKKNIKLSADLSTEHMNVPSLDMEVPFTEVPKYEDVMPLKGWGETQPVSLREMHVNTYLTHAKSETGWNALVKTKVETPSNADLPNYGISVRPPQDIVFDNGKEIETMMHKHFNDIVQEEKAKGKIIPKLSREVKGQQVEEVGLVAPKEEVLAPWGKSRIEVAEHPMTVKQASLSSVFDLKALGIREYKPVLEYEEGSPKLMLKPLGKGQPILPFAKPTPITLAQGEALKVNRGWDSVSTLENKQFYMKTDKGNKMAFSIQQIMELPNREGSDEGIVPEGKVANYKTATFKGKFVENVLSFPAENYFLPESFYEHADWGDLHKLNLAYTKANRIDFTETIDKGASGVPDWMRQKAGETKSMWNAILEPEEETKSAPSTPKPKIEDAFTLSPENEEQPLFTFKDVMDFAKESAEKAKSSARIQLSLDDFTKKAGEMTENAKSSFADFFKLNKDEGKDIFTREEEKGGSSQTAGGEYQTSSGEVLKFKEDVKDELEQKSADLGKQEDITEATMNALGKVKVDVEPEEMTKTMIPVSVMPQNNVRMKKNMMPMANQGRKFNMKTEQNVGLSSSRGFNEVFGVVPSQDIAPQIQQRQGSQQLFDFIAPVTSQTNVNNPAPPSSPKSTGGFQIPPPPVISPNPTSYTPKRGRGGMGSFFGFAGGIASEDTKGKKGKKIYKGEWLANFFHATVNNTGIEIRAPKKTKRKVRTGWESVFY